jgi:REP element-mobilizing transposase RayT
MSGNHTRVGAGFKPARPDRPPSRRTSLRLPDYDYATPGAYFVTVCIKDRKCILGEIRDGEMHGSGLGRIAEETWLGLPHHYPEIGLDDFIVMPNHVHGLLWLNEPASGLSEVIRGFKTFSAKRINQARRTPGQPVWQRRFYDHVVRSEHALDKIRAYILNNPAQWHLDQENPEVARAGLKPAPTGLGEKGEADG